LIDLGEGPQGVHNLGILKVFVFESVFISAYTIIIPHRGVSSLFLKQSYDLWIGVVTSGIHQGSFALLVDGVQGGTGF